jgi:hypothetical protein
MLDVHPLHKPLHGFQEFLLHLFTITVGLLIATQIESCMEWRHHVHLAEEARTRLRAEIESNLKDLKHAQPAVTQWRAEIDADLAAMQRIQDHPDDPASQRATLTVNFSSMSLRDTAWTTAQTTGALALMPYDEAERYANVYKAQNELLQLEEKPWEDTSAINGLIARFHWTDKRKITEDQASQLAEKLGQMRLHLLAGDLLLKQCIEVSEAFLEGRKPNDDFHESLN